MEKYAIIVAGGSSKRMGTATPKQFLEINGVPVLFYSIRAFLEADPHIKIIVVLPETAMEEWSRRITSHFKDAFIDFAEGGSERFLSVLEGLLKSPKNSLVAIHDAARPLVTPTLINRLFQEAEVHGCAIPAIHPTETVRLIYSLDILSPNGENENKEAHSQPSSSADEMIKPHLVLYPRDKVYLIQTPQVFHRDTLLDAYDIMDAKVYQLRALRLPDTIIVEELARIFTDDAAFWESAGHPLHMVEGDINNLKITRKEDLLYAEFLIKNLKKQSPGTEAAPDLS